MTPKERWVVLRTSAIQPDQVFMGISDDYDSAVKHAKNILKELNNSIPTIKLYVARLTDIQDVTL